MYTEEEIKQKNDQWCNWVIPRHGTDEDPFKVSLHNLLLDSARKANKELEDVGKINVRHIEGHYREHGVFGPVASITLDRKEGRYYDGYCLTGNMPISNEPSNNLVLTDHGSYIDLLSKLMIYYFRNESKTK